MRLLERCRAPQRSKRPLVVVCPVLPRLSQLTRLPMIYLLLSSEVIGAEC